MVVKKYRAGGFWGTNLDLVLRSNGITSVVMAGCTTEGCVESTARDAMLNDYYVVIVTDAVASDDRRLAAPPFDPRPRHPGATRP